MPEIIDATLRALATIINFAIIWALQIVYSYQANPRRLEDTTYGVWTNVFAILLHDYLDVFVINPQFSIYTSPIQEEMDPNASFGSHRTTPDSTARGVITDLAITFVTPSPYRRPFAPSSVQEVISGDSFSLFDREDITQTLSLGTWFAPILVELKTPPNRHTHDFEVFMLSRNKRLDAARNQVTEQALCLFSSPKFHLQEEIFLIAGAGEWWTFTIMCREQARNWMRLVQSDEPFSLAKYEDSYWKGEIGSWADENNATVEDATPCNISDAVKQGPALLKAAADRAAKTYREQANRERDRRARRRARDKETADARQQEWINFLETIPESKKFEDHVIDKYDRLEAQITRPSVWRGWPEPEDLRGLTEVAGASTSAVNSKPEFLQPARFGSQRSARYLSFLKGEMRKIAEAERRRRGY